MKRFEPFLINKSTFYRTDSTYLFEHVELESPLKVELTSYQTEHNGYYYSFNCHQSEVQGQTTAEEFIGFERSIKLV